MSDSAWKPVANVPPLQSAPRGTNTSAWAIDTDNIPVTLIDGTWFQAFLPENHLALSLTVGPDGAVWISATDALMSAPYFYRRIGDQDWQAMPMPPDGTVQQLCATGANEVWAIVCKSVAGDCPDSPWIEHYVNGQWQIDHGAPPLRIGSLNAIAGGSDGSVFCIDSIDRIWRWWNQSWQRCIMPTGMHGATAGGGVTEVVTLEDFDLHWHALFVQNGQVNYLAFDGTAWGQLASLNDGSLIGLTLDRHTHNPVGYGVTASGKFLVITVGKDGGLTRAEYDAERDLSDIKTHLTILSENRWVTTAVINGSLMQAGGTAASPLTPDPAEFSPGFNPVSDSQHPEKPARRDMRTVIRLPWTQSDNQNPYTAVVDEAGNIYMVFNLVLGASFELSLSQGSFVQLTGSDLAKFGGAPRVSGVQDDDGNIRLYATDANGKLWVLRQTGTTGNDNNPFTWTQWHPLGNESRGSRMVRVPRTTTDCIRSTPTTR